MDTTNLTSLPICPINISTSVKLHLCSPHNPEDCFIGKHILLIDQAKIF